jgi:homoprotocatechuate degradation regulator HpaR
MPEAFLHRNLPTLLLRARESAMRHFRPGLKRHGLTDQQWRVLRALDEAGELEVGQIAQATAIVGPSLTGVLERMERLGLIERFRISTDQRKVVVRLTPTSHAIVDAHRGEIEAVYTAIEQAIGRERLEQLYELLDRIIDLPDPQSEPPRLQPLAEAPRRRRPVGAEGA